MCGITAGIACQDIAPILIDGLRRLEYRGYDSAGLALVTEEQRLICIKVMGKVQKLSDVLNQEPLAGRVGIAHTRWATHGKPSEVNAHPHLSGQEIALVHNGIIENYIQLKNDLLEKGYAFCSETDTEVVVHYLDHFIQLGQTPIQALQSVVQLLEGAYALAIITRSRPDQLIVARVGSPLVIGVGFDAHFVASDPLALLPVTQDFIYLEEGDTAEVFVDQVKIYNATGERVFREIRTIDLPVESAVRGHFRHFMQKEIFEQPKALRATLLDRLKPTENYLLDTIFGHDAPALFDQVKAIQFVGCGTSFHAGLIAKYWFEMFAGLSCSVDPGSELRYMNKPIVPGTLLVALSQSGETADTLAALRDAVQRACYLGSLSICNVAESALVRETDLSFLIKAGPEVGVASTKTFTTALTALLLLLYCIGRRNAFSSEQQAILLGHLKQLPLQLEALLTLDASIQQWAEFFQSKQHALYLGRGIYYPVVLEGALKLKEISYIHAEAYPAGELKHGPLALVDKKMPVVVVVPNDQFQSKLIANLQEVRARGGEVFAFVEEGVDLQGLSEAQVIILPKVASPYIGPVLFSVPLQLLAYHIAVLKGTDVDQPRNLAKSVTVE